MTGCRNPSNASRVRRYIWSVHGRQKMSPRLMSEVRSCASRSWRTSRNPRAECGDDGDQRERGESDSLPHRSGRWHQPPCPAKKSSACWCATRASGQSRDPWACPHEDAPGRIELMAMDQQHAEARERLSAPPRGGPAPCGQYSRSISRDRRTLGRERETHTAEGDRTHLSGSQG